MFLPGATLGILGGGQLGRLFTIAARSMGYRVVVFDPDADSPAAAFADHHICADYQNAQSLEEMARFCEVVTIEFENVPAQSLEMLAVHCDVAPNAEAVAILQDRIREKTFLRDIGVDVVNFSTVQELQDWDIALSAVGVPALFKVSRNGYDGKGQVRINDPARVPSAWKDLNCSPGVLEALVALDAEISIVLARGPNGEIATYPIVENIHKHGILETTRAPAQISSKLSSEAERIAKKIITKLNYVGVMAVEFFVSEGKLLVNEIAPRPHNSGHYTLDACITDQFEQQVRAICGLPLGDSRLLTPAVMLNVLGDSWRNGKSPDWYNVMSYPNAKLYLYGKKQARPGRKMGHINVIADSLEEAWIVADRIKEKL